MGSRNGGTMAYRLLVKLLRMDPKERATAQATNPNPLHNTAC